MARLTKREREELEREEDEWWWISQECKRAEEEAMWAMWDEWDREERMNRQPTVFHGCPKHGHPVEHRDGTINQGDNMNTIFGTLYAVYNKDEKALVTFTGGVGPTALHHSIVADTDIALAARRMEALQRVGVSRLCLVKIEVNMVEIL